MGNSKLGAVLDHIRRLADPLAMAESDHCLLARFLGSRDDGAFAALLKRHGPMVFGVSRRLLHRVEDAEDVAQATFLLLARKGATIRKWASLSCWLHGVAHRLSLQLKRREMNRLKREKRVTAMRRQAEAAVDSQEIQELLDLALADVPEKYRAALILCCLQGKKQDEAAKELGCPVRTVESRLARGRKLLRKHLANRGLALSAGGLAVFLTGQTATAALPAGLFKAALHAGLQYASGTALPGLVSPAVALLVKNGLKSLALAKMVWMSAGLLVLSLVAGGAGLASRNAQAGREERTESKQVPRAQAHRESKAKSPAPEVEKPRTDRLGDPLPAGALARLGTLRLRHGDSIWHLGFSPDGKTLLSADWHGVHVWDAFTGRHLLRFGDPRDRQFQSIAASADNRLVALSMSEGDIEMWDATTGRKLRQFWAGVFPWLTLSPDGQVLAVRDLGDRGGKDVQSLRLFDASTGIERHRLGGHQDAILSIVFSRDGKTLITSSDDKSIRFWDVGTGKQVRRLDHSTPVRITLSPDGKTMAVVATKKSEWKNPGGLTAIGWMAADEVVLWDTATGKETHRLIGHKSGAKDVPLFGGVNALFFTRDSKILISSDWTTHWWDVSTGKETMEPKLPLGRVSVLAFSPDGSTMATSWHQVVQLWDAATGKQRWLGGGHQESVHAVAISPDDRFFATGGGDNVIRLWDSISGQEIRQLLGHSGAIWSVVFVPDGRTLISTSLDETVRVWELATGKEVRRFAGLSSLLSPDGKLLVTDSKDKFVHVWELATGQERMKWQTTGSDARAFSPDGRIVFAYDHNKKVSLWEVATGKELHQFEGHHFRNDSHDRIYCVAFSPDGKLVAFGGQDKNIALYDMASGKQARLLSPVSSGMSQAYSSLAFSTDGRFLAAGDWGGGTVRFWEMATGAEFQQLAGHKGRVMGMVFSHDAKLLLTGHEDTTALVWDLTGTRTGPKAQPLAAKDLESIWSDLSSADATRGQKAVRSLLAAPEEAAALLTRELKPAAQPDPQRLARLILDLDSTQFKTREEAMRELDKVGDLAAPALRKAIAANATLELKQRTEKLLENISTSQRLRTLRAVQVLEQLGTQRSLETLTRLAEGVSEALLTREAKAAVERSGRLRAANR
jgi:RNA polymerase sigma factor (sigma-70 family)